MANLPHARFLGSDFGGKHPQDHKLVPDSSNPVPHNGHRPSSDTATPGSTHQTGGRGSGESASEDAANEDDDEDSSAAKDGEQEDEEEDDADAFAPSRGSGRGKGKRPAIRIEPVDDDQYQSDDRTASHETGPMASSHLVTPHLTTNKKRTYSNLSNSSVLFEDGDDQFPRPKMARKLSRSGDKPLLTYTADEAAGNPFEEAIESSDEDKNTLDDEDYSGLNMISDDESDVEKMERQEEQYMINDLFADLSDGQPLAVPLFSEEFAKNHRRASIGSYASDGYLDRPFFGRDNFPTIDVPDVGFHEFFEPPAPKSPEPIAKRKFSDSSTKRVRFHDEVQVSDSASSTSSSLDDGDFPDLFMEQDKLPPSLFQLMETDKDSDNEDFLSGGSEQSYWDFSQEDSRALLSSSQQQLEAMSDSESSGYESDMGDTTDDDDDCASYTAQRTPQQNSVLSRPSSAPVSRVSSPRAFQRSAGSGGIAPLRGIFIHEDSRAAIAVTNRQTNKVQFYRPRASVPLRNPNYTAYSSTTSTTNNSPRTSVQQVNLSDSDVNNEVFNNSMMNSADIMFTGIFGAPPASNYLLSGDVIGPPEVFFPPNIFIESNGTNFGLEDDDEYVDDDDEEYGDDVDLADFMEFGSDVDGTDVEQEDETDVPATPAISMIADGSTPAQPTPMDETPSNRRRNVSDVYLEHFDRASVTAFRSNQSRYRDISSLPHDPDLRASVSRPIRSGRSAETLISPLRRRGSMPKKHAGSPLSKVTKASGRLNSSIMNGQRGPRMGTFS